MAKEIKKVDFNAREGIWTLQNVETGEHRTFRIMRKRRGNLEGKFLVSLLRGSDNTEDYTAFAFMDENAGSIHVWRRMRGNGKKSAYEVYAVMLRAALDATVNDGADTFEIAGRQYRVILADFCRRCGRTLTNPESCDLHVGPECRKHYNI